MLDEEQVTNILKSKEEYINRINKMRRNIKKQQATNVSQEHIDLCERYGRSGLWIKKPKLRLVK